MIEKYYLNSDVLPNLPTPHDCVIEAVTIDKDYLVFTFEKDIAQYDSISSINPNFYSLIIRYHLVDSLFYTYKWKSHTTLFGPEGFVLIENKKFISMSKGDKLEYLYHNVGYQSIIVKLFQSRKGGFIIVDAEVDFIEYEWIER